MISVAHQNGMYSWRVCGNFGSLAVIPGSKQLTKLLQVQIIRTREISSAGKFNSQRGIAESIQDVWDDILFCDTDAENLTLAVDTNDTTRRLVICSDKYGFSRDSIHVDADPGF